MLLYQVIVKLGPRITLSTSLLIAMALGIYGFMAVRIRQDDMRANLERQTESLGRALQVSLEAALQEGLFEDLRRLVARVQATAQPLDVAYLELGSDGEFHVPAPSRTVKAGEGAGAAAADEVEAQWQPPVPDETRAARLRRVSIEGKPYGQHILRNGRPTYAYLVPIHDENQKMVAMLDLARDESASEAAISSTRRQVAWTVLAVGIGLALLVWGLVRRAISHPLKRLVEGIDEVSVGDLTPAILRERDDEIGDLADRFNHMTASLREARAETQRNLEAKLALEARLRHSDKLATIGQLAANIAHEIGTPLNVIGGRARTMEKKAGDPAEVAKNAAIIAGQTERITKIIQQMLKYARREKVAERRPLQLDRVVRATLDFLEHQTATSQVAVELEGLLAGAAPSAAFTVAGDADRLQQVCINLCVNALQAMPKGGILTVGCHSEVRRKPGLDVAPPARYMVLEVADTGVGIPPADRERVFEPFYSTKESGGTGLGLAVSQGIVKEHDGWIEVEGRPAGGTLFRVFLPASEERVVADGGGGEPGGEARARAATRSAP